MCQVRLHRAGTIGTDQHITPESGAHAKTSQVSAGLTLSSQVIPIRVHSLQGNSVVTDTCRPGCPGSAHKQEFLLALGSREFIVMPVNRRELL
jgi:hypothetical protein